MSTLLDDKTTVVVDDKATVAGTNGTNGTNGTTKSAGRERSLPELLGDLTGQLVTLGKQEINLAKTELRESAKKSAIDSAGMLAGGVVLHAGMLALFAAVAAGLATVMPVWAALLIVSAVLIIGGGVAIKTGMSKLQEDAHLDHLPDSLHRNRDFIKEKISS